jgi:methionine synthase II (cobalamin-independent)
MAQTPLQRNPPFRAEHLGSLLRPKEFLQQRAAFESKNLSQAELTAAEDEAIAKVVKLQTDLGFRAISDGEYR